MVTDFNFDNFKETMHMLEWLHPSPIEAIKSSFQENFEQQVEGSELLGLHVVDIPQWLTGANPQKHDESKAILVRVGLAFAFELSVKTPENIVHDLSGTYTWVSTNMDKPKEIKQRTWMDLDGTLEEFGSNGALAERIYFNLDN